MITFPPLLDDYGYLVVANFEQFSQKQFVSVLIIVHDLNVFGPQKFV
jgi:hypothetical protein